MCLALLPLGVTLWIKMGFSLQRGTNFFRFLNSTTYKESLDLSSSTNSLTLVLLYLAHSYKEKKQFIRCVLNFHFRSALSSLLSIKIWDVCYWVYSLFFLVPYNKPYCFDYTLWKCPFKTYWYEVILSYTLFTPPPC